MHSVTLFFYAFITAPIIYLRQRTEWKTLIFKWASIWKHDKIHIILLMNILDGWIMRVPRQFYYVDVANKDTLDAMNENILKFSWSKNSLTFRLATELSNVYFMFIALVNLITISWMHLYQIGLSLNKEFYNKGTILESKGMHAIFQKKGKKGQNIWKFEQKGTEFENILKKGKWLCVIIARNKLLE